MHNVPSIRAAILSVLLLVALTACNPNNKTPPPVSNLNMIAIQAGFELVPVRTPEPSFLQSVLPDNRNTPLHYTTLLQGDDRVAAVFWSKSENANGLLQSLKKKSFALFSKEMTNFVDEELVLEGHAPIDVLAFTDPLMSKDRFVIAVIEDHIYEFHVAPEQESLIQGLLLELSTINEQ